MLKCYVYDFRKIVSIQNTIRWNLWWKVDGLCDMRVLEYACEKI